jgi:hypothetical protein
LHSSRSRCTNAIRPELPNDATGPYVAPTNRFEIQAEDDSIRLTYDALNSLTWPVFAVEGTVLTRMPDGTYKITHDERDHYPAIAAHTNQPKVLAVWGYDHPRVGATCRSSTGPGVPDGFQLASRG